MSLTRIDSVDVHYRVDGNVDLPWLMLSNGLGLDLTMWAPQMTALTRHYRVLRYDTRGHGETATPAGPATIEQLGRDVLALMEQLGIRQAHFCGFSMGGIIGMWLGIHAAARIDRLVLAHTAARIGPTSMWDARIATVQAGGMRAISEAAMRRWFTADFIARHPSVVDELRRAMERNDPHGYVSCCAAVRDADFRDAIADIGVPTLVVSGVHDAATTSDDAEFLIRRIPGAQCVELDGAHLSNFERPQEFTAALLGFLDPVPADHVLARSTVT